MGVDASGTSNTVLRAREVGKVFARRNRDVRSKLAKVAWRALFHIPPSKHIELNNSQFWAVRDVSFDLARGEAIGIIGLNGSGKTTLLRMLAGQMPLDSGEVSLTGTSAAMIDLQAGFQSHSSGYENIFLRAAALGFTRQQTQEQIGEIISFAELENAIHAPIATYSSGMRMRLAFSIMAIVSPDVLFIDEILAVGDFRFRQKCLAKVRQMRTRSAFVFVSHSMGDVTRFCDRVIVMHKGHQYFEGQPEDAIEVYESLDSGTPVGDIEQRLVADMGPIFVNEETVSDVEHFWCDLNGNPISEVKFDQSFAMRIRFKSEIDMRHLILGVPVWAENRHYTTGLSTQINSDRFDVSAGEEVDIILVVEGGYINPGTLKSMLAIMDGPEFIFRKSNPDLTILKSKHPTWGAITIPHKWQRHETETDPQQKLKVARLRR